MARIIGKDNHLQREYRKNRRNTAIGKLLVFICTVTLILLLVVWLIFKAPSPYIMLLPLVGILIGVIIFRTSKAEQLKSGIDGEAATAKIISSLPGSYVGFKNARISYNNKASEIDMIVVGPSGIFIIETKNHSGVISGHYSGVRWHQNKRWLRGSQHSKDFFSPINQVGTHVYRLGNYLRQNGVRVNINAVVFFSNPKTEVKLSGNAAKTPVFSASKDGAKLLVNYILNGNDNLEKQQINSIVKLIGKA